MIKDKVMQKRKFVSRLRYMENNILKILHRKTIQFVSYLNAKFCLQTENTIESI